MRRHGLLALSLVTTLVSGADARRRRITCIDGRFPTRERVRRLRVACDTDGVADGTCTFSFPTGLRCVDCPIAVTVEVPLDGQRVVSQQVTAGLFRGRVVCRRAPRQS